MSWTIQFSDDTKNDTLLATVWKSDPSFLVLDLPGDSGHDGFGGGGGKMVDTSKDKNKTSKYFEGLLSRNNLKESSASTLENVTRDLSIAIKSNPIPLVYFDNALVSLFTSKVATHARF